MEEDFMRFVGRGIAAQNAADSALEEQAKLALAPAGAKCAKCGRAFTAPGQYRYRGADGAAICRDARGCAVRAEGK